VPRGWPLSPRRLLAPVAALALAVAACAAVSGRTPPHARRAGSPAPRAAWAYTLADLPPPALAAALDALAARRVTRVFLSVEDGRRFRLDDAEGRAGVGRVVAAAGARGMAVHAMLLQDPRWIDHPAEALRRVEAAARFGDGPGERRFHGLHLDIEPYTLDAWECGGPEGRARLVARLAGLAAAARRAAGAARLPLSLAVPWWALRDDPVVAGSPGAALAAAADELVLMAYGEPGGPLVGGEPERLACRVGLPGLLEQAPAGGRLTVGLAGYEHRDAAHLDEAADHLDARFGADPRWGGVALFLDGGRPGHPLVVSVRGRVVLADGRPARGAAVSLVGDGRLAAAAVANECGRFVLRAPVPGAATLVAEGREGGRAGRPLAGLVAGREREVGTLVLGDAGGAAAERERAIPGVGGALPAKVTEGGATDVGTPRHVPPDPALPPYAEALARAHALAEAGEHERAEAAYVEILARWPAMLDARIGLARLDAWRDRLEAAAAAYRVVLGERCDAAEAILGLADLARRENRLAEAEALYRRVADAWPHEPAGFVGLGRVALADGRAAEARAPLERALALDPSDAEARELLSRAREAAR
jgi:Tetratricopeptide repeat